MTPIRAPIKRLTAIQDPDHSGQPLVILIEEGGAMIRVKPRRQRSWYSCSLKQLWRLAVQNRADEIKAERIAKRKAKRLAARGL